jgi:hypothetical protein
MLANNSLSLGDERALLQAARDVDPPPGMKDDVWSALATRLPPGGGGPDGSGGEGSALGAAKAAVWKKVAIGFAMGLVGMGSAELASNYGKSSPVVAARAPSTAAAAHETPTPAPPTPAAIEISPVEPTRPPSRVEATPMPAEPADPTKAEDPAAKRKSQLADESRMLRQARGALHSGNHGGALAILNELSKQHPSMILAQEHEALMIDTLLASGGQTAARERARRFLQTHPGSPHAAKMKSIADGQQSP